MEKIKFETKQRIGIMYQVLVGVFLLFSAILSFLEPEMMSMTQSLLLLMFLVLAYNNQFIFKRKYYTVIYIVIAIIIGLFIIF